MKTKFLSLVLAAAPCALVAQTPEGWPADYEGVMLQGFYWDSFVDTRWENLERQSDELARFFNLIWVPQSGNCNTSGNTMGYLPVYLFDHNSSFGTVGQLRSMLRTFKSKGLLTLADVVINHRNNLGQNGSWVDYPAEIYKDVRYQMLPTDIVSDDDKGGTKSWADSRGISLSNNADTGRGWDGCRDIDHKSDNVRTNYKAYLNFLLNDLGYSGFRYDMVIGYSPAFTAEYNMSAHPSFSVGEYWEKSSDIKSWLEGTKVNGQFTSAAFDFPFRYAVRDAVNKGDYRYLAGADKAPLINDDTYRRYAVTFVENHDTQYRSSSEPLDPIRKDTLAANAFLLAMPGTPCVFLRHWQAYKREIQSMIELRKYAGIANTSVATNFASATDHYAVRTRGKHHDLLCVVGPGLNRYIVPNGFVPVLSGHHYVYALSRSARTAWIDVPAGEYAEPFMAQLAAVTDEAATLVYSTDGSVLSASSKVAPVDGKIAISENCTLRVGLLRDGQVSGVVERAYVIKPFEAHTATIYVRNENPWTSLNFYLWDNNQNTQLNGGWPGKAVSETRVVKGQTWHCQTVNIPTEHYYVNAVFSSGSGSPQTIDVTNITSDRYYVISTTLNGGKYVVNDVTSTVTGISSLTTDSSEPRESSSASASLYDLSGRRVYTPHKGALYIDARGKKVMK